MPAPVASFVQCPDDTANVGKKIRTETRVVGANTVHEHFYVPTIGFTIVSRYFFVSDPQTVSVAAQNGTTTGFLWFQNPASSTITMVLRSIVADSGVNSLLATPTSPVISFSKGTYTGTATGTTDVGTPAISSGATHQVIIRTASTGMTITKGADFGQFAIPSTLTAIGPFYATKVVYAKNPLAFVRGLDIEFAPGECMIVWQLPLGTTADTRQFSIQVEWDEVDLS